MSRKLKIMLIVGLGVITLGLVAAGVVSSLTVGYTKNIVMRSLQPSKTPIRFVKGGDFCGAVNPNGGLSAIIRGADKDEPESVVQLRIAAAVSPYNMHPVMLFVYREVKNHMTDTPSAVYANSIADSMATAICGTGGTR